MSLILTHVYQTVVLLLLSNVNLQIHNCINCGSWINLVVIYLLYFITRLIWHWGQFQRLVPAIVMIFSLFYLTTRLIQY